MKTTPVQPRSQFDVFTWIYFEDWDGSRGSEGLSGWYPDSAVSYIAQKITCRSHTPTFLLMLKKSCRNLTTSLKVVAYIVPSFFSSAFCICTSLLYIVSYIIIHYVKPRACITDCFLVVGWSLLYTFPSNIKTIYIVSRLSLLHNFLKQFAHERCGFNFHDSTKSLTHDKQSC